MMTSFNLGFRTSLHHVSCFSSLGVCLCSICRNNSDGTVRKLMKASRSSTSSSCIRRPLCPKSALLRIHGLTQNLLGALILLLLCWRSWAGPRSSSASFSSSRMSTWSPWSEGCSVMVLVSPSKTRHSGHLYEWQGFKVTKHLRHKGATPDCSSVACTLIFQTCCKTRAEIAEYRTQSHDGRTMTYYFCPNIVVCRTISYKLEADRAKLL